MKEVFLQKAILELEQPSLEATVQYLEVMDLQFENDQWKVERVDLESSADSAVVYFAVKEAPFFLAVYFSKETQELIQVTTENGNQVYLTATSKQLTFDQLASVLQLDGFSGWSLNEPRKIGKGHYNFSRLSFEPIQSRAYDLETKLHLLLTALEKDRAGVRKLTEMADVIIVVHHQQYISGNKGLHFDLETIKRLHQLNLGMDIDQYVFGKELTDIY